MTKRAAAANQMSEQDLLKQITDWLTLYRYFWYRNNVGAMSKENPDGKYRFIKFGRNGAPDLIVVDEGLFVGIEVKLNGKEQSRVQYQFQCDVERAGGRYIIAHSLEDVLHAFNRKPTV